jgi:RNA 3'-terminal phosphate cyclase (ATP)
MISIDGNFEEGGGSIVRVALALSAITNKPFEVHNIRKGRPKEGLKNQHLYCIKALEQLCDAKVEGAELGSSYLKFEPGAIKGQTISIDIGTAGSISLFLQALMLPAIFADSPIRLKITGGTDTKWAMPFDYFNNVYLPHLKKYADIEARLEKRGYYPKGAGKVDIKIKPNLDDQKINLIEQGKLIQIKGISHASLDLQKANVAERQAKAAKLSLQSLECLVNIQTQYQNTLSVGSGIVLWAIFSKDPDEINFINPIIIGADSLGKKGKKSEQIGKEASDNLIKEINSKAPVDKYLADNLIPLISLKGGKMVVSEITKHSLANIYVCEKFLGKVIEVEGKTIKSIF